MSLHETWIEYDPTYESWRLRTLECGTLIELPEESLMQKEDENLIHIELLNAFNLGAWE